MNHIAKCTLRVCTVDWEHVSFKFAEKQSLHCSLVKSAGILLLIVLMHASNICQVMNNYNMLMHGHSWIKYTNHSTQKLSCDCIPLLRVTFSSNKSVPVLCTLCLFLLIYSRRSLSPVHLEAGHQ